MTEYQADIILSIATFFLKMGDKASFRARINQNNFVDYNFYPRYETAYFVFRIKGKNISELHLEDGIEF